MGSGRGADLYKDGLAGQGGSGGMRTGTTAATRLISLTGPPVRLDTKSSFSFL